LTFQVTKKTKYQKPDIMRREWFSEDITGPWSSDFFLDRFKPVG